MGGIKIISILLSVFLHVSMCSYNTVLLNLKRIFLVRQNLVILLFYINISTSIPVREEKFFVLTLSLRVNL